MRKIFILPLILSLVLVVFPLIYATEISVGTVNQIGGTGQVDVVCPVSGCSIDQVKWVIESNPPFHVEGVDIVWTPTTDSAQYTVYVTVYDDTGTNMIGSGSATQTGSTSTVTTSITFSSPIDPADIYKVEIVIVQTS